MMSKENAKNFMTALGKDKELKSAYLGVMVKYEDKSLSEDKWSKIVQEEVIPLAKERGYDFNTEEFEALQKQTEKLSDEELDHVTGGSTQFATLKRKMAAYLE
jgi:predicted ribosomally synthesized peptide with nif11-like leader